MYDGRPSYTRRRVYDGRRLYGRTVVPDFRNIRKSPKIFEREPLSEPLPIPKIVPKYSVFYFRESRYNFAKLYRIPKLLPKRMALLTIKT